MILNFNTNLGTGTTVTLPLAGTVDVDIDWGDESGIQSVSSAGNLTHTYASDGEYTVTITGSLTEFKVKSPIADMAKLVSIDSFGDLGLITVTFKGSTNLTSVPNTLPSTVTSVATMFFGCTSFNDDSISSWDVSNVNLFGLMFSGATSFNRDLDNWDMSSATIAAGMFTNATAFNRTLGTKNMPNLTNITNMFKGATSFNQPIDFVCPSLASAGSLLEDATSFNKPINLSTNLLTSTSGMFKGATSFNQPVSFNLPVATSTTSMFEGATSFNSPVTLILGAGEVLTPGMFLNCTSYEGTDLSINTENVTSTHSMFLGCSKFNGANLVDWDVSKNETANRMFEDCAEFNQDIGEWDTSSMLYCPNMFYGASKFDQDLGSWDMASISGSCNLMFTDSGMSVENYSKTLIGWASQSLQSGINLDASVGYGTSATESRATLVNTYGWNITDGGLLYKIIYTSNARNHLEGETIQYVAFGENGTEISIIDNPIYAFLQWSDGLKTKTRTYTNVQGDLRVSAIFSISGALRPVGSITSDPSISNPSKGGKPPLDLNRGNPNGDVVDNSTGRNPSRNQAKVYNVGSNLSGMGWAPNLLGIQRKNY